MYRVRIKKLPNKAMGGTKTGQQTSDGALAIQPTAMGGADIDQYIGEKETTVTRTLKPTSREKANVEVEKNEIVVGDLNGDGMIETYVAGGKRHTEGGTPLNLPDDTFIFSDTKSMRIKDPEILKKFGKSSGSYTPADLARQYDINQYRKILQDPNTDKVDRKTAELMIRNYTMKLGALALAQEGKKGFPQGVPQLASPFLQANQIDQEQIMPSYQPKFTQENEEEDQSQEEVSYDESMPSQEEYLQMMQQAPMAAYGMQMGGYYLPFAQEGSSIPFDNAQTYAKGGYLRKAALGEAEAPVEGVDPYEQAKTKQGNVTPTGKSNKFSATGETTKDYLNRWEGIIPGIGDMTDAQAQDAIYDWTLQNNPDEVKRMWKEFGITTQGKAYGDLMNLTDYDPKAKKHTGTFNTKDLTADELKALKKAYVDGKFGARKLNPVAPEPEKQKEPDAKVIDKTTKTTKICKCVNSKGDSYDPGKDANGNCNPCQGADRADLVDVEGEELPVATYPEWTTPDLMNLFGTIQDKARINKYFPWAAPVDLEEAKPIYLDPTRELAAQSEQTNVILQGLGQFVGPQAMSSRASGVQGTGARQAADTLSRYNNANVGIANQFAQNNVQTRNQERLQNQAISKALYDQTTMTNQMYDNATAAAEQNKRLAFATGWKNASDLAMLNATSAQYDVDPKTGTVVFTGGKDLQPEEARQFDYYVQYYRRQGFEPKEAIQAAKIAIGQGSSNLDSLLAGYKDGGAYVMGDNIFPFMFY